MCFGMRQRIILFLFVLVNCVSCITFGPSPYETISNRDCSFSITGKVLETNYVTSVIEYSLIKTKDPLPEAGISLLGQIKKPALRKTPTALFFPSIKLKYQDNGPIYFLPDYIQPYRWEGTVIIDGYSMNTAIEFDIYAEKSGSGKQFILKRAALGQTRIEFEDPFDIYNNKGDFPFHLGYVHISSGKYRVYAVLDNSPNRTPFDKDVFYNLLQKFQFLDERDTVIAELENDTYTIYDTIPETETGDLKMAIALLVGFRHSTSILRDIRGWDVPMFYHYVY